MFPKQSHSIHQYSKNQLKLFAFYFNTFNIRFDVLMSNIISKNYLKKYLPCISTLKTKNRGNTKEKVFL